MSILFNQFNKFTHFLTQLLLICFCLRFLFAGSIIYICQPIGSIISAVATGMHIFVFLLIFYRLFVSINGKKRQHLENA